MPAGADGTAGPSRACAAHLLCSRGRSPAVLLINSVTSGKLLGSLRFQLFYMGGDNRPSDKA